jgi:hypothetical protein
MAANNRHAEQLSSLTNSDPRGAFIESGDFDSRRAVPPAANQNASQALTARTQSPGCGVVQTCIFSWYPMPFGGETGKT